MAHHNFSQNDRAIPTNWNTEQPVSLYLSKIENQREEEIDAVYNELLTILYPKQERKLISINFWSMIAPTHWDKIFLYGALFLLVFSITILKFSQSSILLVYIVLSGITGSVILLLLSCAASMKRTWKSSREITQSNLNRINNESLAEREKVSKLRSIATSENLKTIEIDLEKYVKEIQSREKVILSMSLILAIAAWWIFISIIGMPIIQQLKNYLDSTFWRSFLNFIGIPGAAALLGILFNIIIALGSTARLQRFERCLSLLKKAQIANTDNELETYSKPAQAEKSGTKKSFMSQIREISIEAPSDFSVNYHQYMSGDKNIESDIH